MWPMLLPGLIAGGASLLGNIFSSNTSAQNTQANIQAQQAAQNQTMAFNAEEAGLSRQFNAAEAAKTRDFAAAEVTQQEAFQQQMSGTAYQRARADMQKAGLNPILMASQGGASTPSGGAAAGASASGPSASVGTPNMALSHRTSPIGDIGSSVTTGIDAMVKSKMIDRLTQEVSNLETEQTLKAAQTSTEREKPELVHAEGDRAKATAQQAQLELPGYEFASKSAKDLLKIPDVARAAGTIAGWTGNRLNDVLAPLVGTAKGVFPFLPKTGSRFGTRDGPSGASSFEETWQDRIGR